MSTSDFPARRLTGSLDSYRARAIPAEAWITGALVLVAAVIRIAVINDQSFWQDEALTAYEAQLPLGAMIHTVVHVETTPPLYFLVIWVWAHLFGTSEVALRSVSMLAGVALVPVAYVSGRDLVGARAGVVAAALITFNPFLIWYSQEARAYMLLALLAGASFMWFVRARTEPTRGNVAWWAACSSLALMTHFFAGFLVAPEAIWLLWIARTRLVAGAVAVTVAVQLAMLPFALADTGHGVGWISQTPRLTRVSQAVAEWGVSIMYRRATVDQGLLGGAAVLVLAAALITFGGDARTRRGAAVAAAIGGFVWVAPLALGVLSPSHDYFLSRNVIPAVVPLAVLLAAACAAPRARVLGGTLAVVLIAMFAYATIQVQTHAYLQRPNWRAVARSLGPAPATRAILAANGTTADPLKIYLPRVNWVQPQSVQVRISEIDIVGAIKQVPLRLIPLTGGLFKLRAEWYTPIASPVPRSVSVQGARLLDRYRVSAWVVARFALDRPARLSVMQLLQLAPRYFRRTPLNMLVFFQRGEDR